MSFIRPLAQPAMRIRCIAAPPVHASQFHSSATVYARTRVTRDRNPQRGVSAIHRRGQKEPLSVSKMPLPEPVLDPTKHTKVEVDEDHGLWGFFHKKKALPTPEEDHQHGRAWTVEELRHKSWEDLHKLWWVCAKELNIMATQELERKRIKPGYGEYESQTRRRAIQWTQRAIKHTLTERAYAWQEAKKLAATDEEVDLSGDGPAYVPLAYEESVPPTEPEAAAPERQA
ncbi:54S ribosomal protein L4 mitochondrial [Rhizina undulata]